MDTSAKDFLRAFRRIQLMVIVAIVLIWCGLCWGFVTASSTVVLVFLALALLMLNFLAFFAGKWRQKFAFAADWTDRQAQIVPQLGDESFFTDVAVER